LAVVKKLMLVKQGLVNGLNQ